MFSASFPDGFEKDALTIHDFCAKEFFGSDLAKLLTYVHLKIQKDGLDGLLESDADVSALRILLGQEDEFSNYPSELRSKLQAFSKIINKTDHKLCQETGKERGLAGELQERLRFHIDRTFQDEILYLYYTQVLQELDPDLKKWAA